MRESAPHGDTDAYCLSPLKGKYCRCSQLVLQQNCVLPIFGNVKRDKMCHLRFIYTCGNLSPRRYVDVLKDLKIHLTYLSPIKTQESLNLHAKFRQEWVNGFT